MDVGAWLRGLGLGRYEPAFRDNDIDAEVLPRLTAEDLGAIGVSSVGHRRKLLDAIAALRDGTPPAPAPAVGAEAEPAMASAAAPRVPEAERRQLTVMFADLVGSTALATALDPEDLREIIAAYHGCVAAVVERFEGHVAKYLGDGVLAYFGWPIAHEDDAERAVRAALELVQAVGRLAPRENLTLHVRAGIATGVVVVGDLIGEGAAREEAVVGETPNLAARLQELAEPGGVVVAPGTRRLLGGLFEGEDLGARALKGFAEPVRAWRVLGPGAAEGRFEARHHSAGPTPLVGREEELALLLHRWGLAKGGEGQVVLLSGEPGIGKSRLLRALRERLAREPHTPLAHFCSPYHTHSALHPVIGLLERAAGLRREEPAGRRLAKLEALLARATDEVGAAAPLLADLLAIPIEGRYPPLTLSPRRKKERTFEALLGQLAGLAARQPVLALYEDVHWIDPSTLELLGLVVERAQCSPVLAVVTFRPEFDPPWMEHGHVTALSLSRLGRQQGGALVERVAGGKALPEEVVERIAAKADGVPLFAEELTKAVLESGLLVDAGEGYELAEPLPALAIPATLHDSLMARLDRLAPAAREVAQVGAVLGREFGHALLAAVAPLDEAGLRHALDRLIASGLVIRRAAPPAATYTFKHALVRDAAYGSLLRGRRRQLHACVAEVLEERFPETAEAEPELLAHHCTEAGLTEKAVGYGHRAGQRAIARSALAEAVAHLSRGLDVLAGLPAGPERRRWELDLQVALGGALIGAKGYAAEETGRAFGRARELCEEMGDVQRLLPVMNGQVLFYNERCKHQPAHDTARGMLELAQRQGDPALLIPAHRAMALTSFELGRYAASRNHAEQVLALYDPARHRALASLYAFDQRAVALGYLCMALFALGYPDQARRRSDEQLDEARRLAHPNTWAQALFRACVFRRHARDTEGLQEAAESLVAVATEHGLPYFLAIGRLFRGRAWVERGRAEEGLGEIKQGAAAVRATGKRLPPTYESGLLAEAHALAGRPLEAARWAAETVAWTGEDASPWFEASRHRRDGQLLLLLGEPDRAEACFRRALEVARAQDARIWELCAATSLARLWCDQGRRGAARDLLAPVYGWFTEGFDTPDLAEAGVLLDGLP